MSDYISKQETMQRFLKEIEHSRSDCIHINTIKRLLADIATVDEKEVIRKPMERVLTRLNKKQSEFRQARHGLSIAMYTNEKAYNKARILTQKELVINEAKQIIKEEIGVLNTEQIQ